MKPSVLLLGASGFIGAHVRRAIEGDARFGPVLAAGRDRIDLYGAGPEAYAALVDDAAPDVVVNCAGLLDGSAAALTVANTLVTARLVEAISAVRPGVRLVRIGSAGEYGPMVQGHAVREDDPAAPVSAYGISHHAATRLLAVASAAGGVDGITLRVFNPIGWGIRDATVLGVAARRISGALAAGENEIRLGPLGAHRDFVDARDVAAAVVAAALVPALPGRVLNIGSGRAVTTRHAVARLAEVAGFTGAVVEAPVPGGRSAAVSWSLADISAAAAGLGWRPVRSLEDSVAAIWAETQILDAA